jgi:hypothetical protein
MFLIVNETFLTTTEVIWYPFCDCNWAILLYKVELIDNVYSRNYLIVNEFDIIVTSYIEIKVTTFYGKLILTL